MQRVMGVRRDTHEHKDPVAPAIDAERKTRARDSDGTMHHQRNGTGDMNRCTLKSAAGSAMEAMKTMKSERQTKQRKANFRSS